MSVIFSSFVNYMLVIFSTQNYVIAPLHVAAKYGNLNIVTLLVEKGSKIDIPNKVGLILAHNLSCNGL